MRAGGRESRCQITVEQETEFKTLGWKVSTNPDFSNGYLMKLGGGSTSPSFHGELAEINFYSPASLSNPSIKTYPI